MALIQWDEKYSVYVQKLDAQHQGLVSIINQLHDAMRQGKGKEVIGDVLDKLVDYTKIHFTAEEELLAQYGYPGLGDQRKQHAELVRQVEEYRDRNRQGHLALSMEVMNFLKDGWLLRHILDTDKKYDGFFRDHGVK